MQQERSPTALVQLASGIDDLDEGLTKEKAGELALILAERMRQEFDPLALLGLCSGFMALAEQADDDQSEGLAAPLLARNADRNTGRRLCGRMRSPA